MAVIECPFCNELLKIEPPDRFHISVSAKPIPKTFLGDIIQKQVICRNEECKRKVTVYWIAPIEYFTRM
jgi:hypothetical protein